MEDIRIKIQNMIDTHVARVEQEGHISISVCNAPNWDINEWTYREDLISACRRQGFSVETAINFGVTDISVRKSLELQEDIEQDNENDIKWTKQQIIDVIHSSLNDHQIEELLKDLQKSN